MPDIFDPLGLDPTQLLIWGMLVHLFGDFFLQNDWQAKNKANIKWQVNGKLPVPDKAAWVHAGIHAVIQIPLFGVASLLIGALHMLIDLRTPLTKWKQFFKQTIDPPLSVRVTDYRLDPPSTRYASLSGIGMHVSIWQDQVAHLLILGIVALLVNA
jgi:hypothetical protein